MSSIRSNLLIHMPFYTLTDFDIEKEFESVKKYIISLMKENSFDNIIKEQAFLNILDKKDSIQCKYFDIDDFVTFNTNQNHCIKIFSMNISSLPRHAGELVCYLKSLETEFDVIVLCEIGGHDLSTVIDLFQDYCFYYNTPINNRKGGVGIYVSKRLGKIIRNPDVELIKTCGCSVCEIECVCLSFECYHVTYSLIGVYRHPKGNKKHFINDLETSLAKLNRKHVTYLIGDINIDLLLFNKNKDHSDYASMLFSNGFLPYTSTIYNILRKIFVKSRSNLSLCWYTFLSIYVVL